MKRQKKEEDETLECRLLLFRVDSQSVPCAKWVARCRTIVWKWTVELVLSAALVFLNRVTAAVAGQEKATRRHFHFWFKGRQRLNWIAASRVRSRVNTPTEKNEKIKHENEATMSYDVLMSRFSFPAAPSVAGGRPFCRPTFLDEAVRRWKSQRAHLFFVCLAQTRRLPPPLMQFTDYELWS